MFERHALQQVGGFLQQGLVALFGAVELQAFQAVHGVHITALGDFTRQPFKLREFIVQIEQLQGRYRKHFGVLQHLDAL